MIEFSSAQTQAHKAADRFESLGLDFHDDEISFVMDLTAADGVNGNPPIDWDALLGAPDFDFVHDCSGIMRHIDRSTGRLGGCFVPRCAIT